LTGAPRLIEKIRAMGIKVRLHICGSTRKLFADMSKFGADIVDLDRTTALDEARQAIGPQRVALSGIDPVRVLRNSDPDSVECSIGDCHRHAGERCIVGAGCEVACGKPYENVRALAHCTREHL
jgi:uroporphyrinogen-III decarboxylase